MSSLLSVKKTRSEDQAAVGSLLYLSTKTCPDIAYAVGRVARFCAKPTKDHWMAIKRILRYLKGTFNFGLNNVHLFALDMRIQTGLH